MWSLECSTAPVSEQLSESTCSHVPNSAEMCAGAPFLNFPLVQHKLTWKTSLLVKSEMLELFFKTLATDHMCSRHN